MYSNVIMRWNVQLVQYINVSFKEHVSINASVTQRWNQSVQNCRCSQAFTYMSSHHSADDFDERMFMIHYNDVTMSAFASQITSLTVVYSTVYSAADQRKHQSSASLVFVRGIHRGPLNSPHKWPVTRKMFPFDDVIMFESKFSEVCFWAAHTSHHWFRW